MNQRFQFIGLVNNDKQLNLFVHVHLLMFNSVKCH